MSSTSRGYERHVSDYYVTPVGAIVEFLKEFNKHEPDVLKNEILDPCSGGDEYNLMSYPEALKQVGVGSEQITTMDIRGDSLAEFKGDYLDLPTSDYDLIITNPPFNLSEAIINKAMEDVVEGGWVVMLLRLNYFGSKKRFEGFWKEVGLPNYVFVHHKRMSFTDNGKTDSIEYAHFCWKKGDDPDFTKLSVI